jgi:tetratricopeptide (TPR) repeat protein
MKRALWSDSAGQENQPLVNAMVGTDKEVGVYDPQAEARDSAKRWPRVVLRILAIGGQAGLGAAVCLAVLWFRREPPTNEPNGEAITATVASDTELDSDAVPYAVTESPTVSDSSPSSEEEFAAADLRYLAKNYHGALSLYDQLQSAHGNSASGEAIAYRRALCLERLGRSDEALAVFREIVDRSRDDQLRDAARLGLARVWRGQARPDPARATLYGVLLNSATNPTVLSAALHELAQVTAGEVEPPDSSWFHPSCVIRRFPEVADEQFTLDLAKPAEAAESGRFPAGLTVLDQFTPNPRDIIVSAEYSSVGVARFLEEVTSKTGLTFQVDPVLRQSLQARSMRLAFRELSLATTLDAILEPTGLCWLADEGKLLVTSLADLTGQQTQTHRLDQALRLGRRAVALHPDAPQMLSTSLCLGNLSFWSGNYPDAIGAYREIQRRSQTSGVMAVVSFNEAKCLLQMDQRREAEEPLYRAIDSGRGQTVEAVSYTHLGKLFLENWQFDNATRHLARGLSLARDVEIQGVAAITLAAAYLLDGNTQTANQTLYDHRAALQDEPARSQAAFLSSLARYRSAVTPLEEVQRGRQLANALGLVEASRFFSDVGFLLVSQAYQELGLADQQEATLRTAAESVRSDLLRHELQLSLARQLHEAARYSEAEEAYRRLADEEGGERSREARIGVAEIAYLTKQFDLCLRQCYDLVGQELTNEQKQRILRLMGTVYQTRQQHAQAALCFAGMVPAMTPDAAASGPERQP